MTEKHAYIKDGEPFVLINKNAPAAIICLHGFCASPYEIKPVADELGKAGFHVVAPAIPGHAIAPKELGLSILSGLKYNDWIQGIKRLVDDLKTQFDKIFIYGQSMGGAIALALATMNIVDAVAVTGAAIRLQTVAHVFGPILSLFNTNFKRTPQPGSPKNVTYSSRPSKAIYQLVLLGKKVMQDLRKITCPVFIGHSQIDDTVPPKVPTIIEKKAINANVQIQWFNKSSHVYTLDTSAGEVIESIKTFFLEQR